MILDGSCELNPALVYTVKLWYANTPEAEGRVLSVTHNASVFFSRMVVITATHGTNKLCNYNSKARKSQPQRTQGQTTQT